MKKHIALLLVLVLTLSLCACGGKETAAFQAGFGKADISPQELGVPMSGGASSSERLSTGFASYLYAIAVALKDMEGNTAILVSLDHCSIDTGIANDLRSWAEETYQIPKENIIISSIHQHNTVDATNKKIDAGSRYKEYMIQGIKDSISQAVEDLSPTEVYINKVTTEAMNFVRHYWANDGSLVTSHTGNKSSGLKGYESESDKEMRLVKFVRAAEDKDDIVLVNFQAHPHLGLGNGTTNYYLTHSDWPGIMRDLVTEELGVNCIYFSGAGGNLDSSSKIVKDNVSRDYRHHGERAAEYVVGAEDGYTQVNVGTIKAKEVVITYDTDHSMDGLLEQAQIINDLRYNVSSTAADNALSDYPEIHSIFHATAIVSKAAAGTTRDMPISAISFGDIAITCHPYEMFDTNGMELRSGTVGNENYAVEDQLENPYAMTLIASVGNGANGYIPSKMGYTNGGYSTDITRFAPGTGEQVVGDMLAILNELHEG